MNGAKDNKRLSQIELDVLIDFLSEETVIGYEAPLYHKNTLKKLRYLLCGPEKGWSGLLQNFCVFFHIIHKLYDKKTVQILYAVGSWNNANIKRFFSLKSSAIPNVTVLEYALQIEFSEDDIYILNFSIIPVLVSLYHLMVTHGGEKFFIGYKVFHEKTLPHIAVLTSVEQAKEIEKQIAHEIRKCLPRTNHEANIYRILYAHFSQNNSINAHHISDDTIFHLWLNNLQKNTDGLSSYESVLKHAISFLEALEERALKAPSQFLEDTKYFNNLSDADNLSCDQIATHMDYTKCLMKEPYCDRKWMRSHNDWPLLQVLTEKPVYYMHKLPMSFLRTKTAKFLREDKKTQKKTTYSVQYHHYRMLQKEFEQTMRTILLRFIENKHPETIIMIHKLKDYVPEVLQKSPRNIKQTMFLLQLLQQVSDLKKMEDIKQVIEGSDLELSYRIFCFRIIILKM